MRIQDLPKTETFVSKSQNALVKETLKPANNKLNLTLKPYSVAMAMVKGHKGIYQEVALGIDTKEELMIYPNPADHQLNIEIPDEAIKSIEILDLNGKVVLIGKSNQMILPENISKGNYIIRINIWLNILKNSTEGKKCLYSFPFCKNKTQSTPRSRQVPQSNTFLRPLISSWFKTSPPFFLKLR